MSKYTHINTRKKWLFYFIMALLMLPIIQEKTDFIKINPLKGSFQPEQDINFSLNDWFAGRYSFEKEQYLNENFGFRNLFVRLYNQIQYSLFNEAKANGVIIGEEQYLYEENYILSYLGRDFIGEDKIQKKVEKLRKIVDTLKTKNIDLIVILAPGKGSFYPEYIPRKYNPNYKKQSNYDIYKKMITKDSINLLDFYSWFMNMKSSSKYPLFPKTGIHWSKYGEFLVADSIIKYINSKNNQLLKSEIIINSIDYSTRILDTDDDIEKGMNLLLNIKDLKMGYPNFQFKKSDSLGLKILTVADSYYWGLFNSGLSKDAFNNGQFWFYNQEIYPDSYQEILHVSDINLQSSLESNDVIILLSTDANLNKFAFGFIEQVYELYFD